MGEDDPYQRQWDLKPRIDALRAESAAIRNHTDAEFQRRMTDMGTERDRLARQKAASEQAAKAAEQQVEQERKLAGEKGREAEHMEALAAAAEAKGDAVEAEELREAVRGTLASQEAHVARARQAQLDAATTREEVSAHDRRLTEADVRIEDARWSCGRPRASSTTWRTRPASTSRPARSSPRRPWPATTSPAGPAPSSRPKRWSRGRRRSWSTAPPSAR